MTDSVRASPPRPHYYPSIDGLRTVAILAVMLHHLVDPILPGNLLWWGWTGVDLFFVISGFLITGILYDTLRNKHFFRNFYIRRTLRIFPLFYVVWLALLIASIFAHVAWNKYDLLDALYLLNWFAPGSQLNHHPQSLLIFFHRYSGSIVQVNIAHFWSLAIEEQFYMVWPLLIWIIRRRETLMYICGAAVVLVPLLRTYIYIHSSLLELQAEAIIVSSYTRFDTLLMGAWAALWIRSENAPSAQTVKKLAHLLIAIPLAVILIGHLTIGLHWPLTIYHPMIDTYELTLIGMVAVGLVLSCLHKETLIAQIMRQRPLLHFGRISYGLYIFHYLFLEQIRRYENRYTRHHLEFVVAFLAIFGTYIMARFSYQFIERPFLNLKSRFTDKDHASAPLTVTPI